MRIVHEVQIDKENSVQATLSVDAKWIRLDSQTKDGTYTGGYLIRKEHVVKVERQRQDYEGVPYFWIVLVDRDKERTNLPFALTGDEATQFVDAIVA